MRALAAFSNVSEVVREARLLLNGAAVTDLAERSQTLTDRLVDGQAAGMERLQVALADLLAVMKDVSAPRNNGTLAADTVMRVESTTSIVKDVWHEVAELTRALVGGVDALSTQLADVMEERNGLQEQLRMAEEQQEEGRTVAVAAPVAAPVYVFLRSCG